MSHRDTLATSRQYCHVVANSNKGGLTGLCKTNTSVFEFFPKVLQQPGELCDGIRAIYECANGYKKCKAQRCLGFAEDSKCQSSFDCNVNFFCDTVHSSNKCRPIIANGLPCMSNDQCGKSSLCKYMKFSDREGVCTSLFSLAKGECKQ